MTLTPEEIDKINLEVSKREGFDDKEGYHRVQTQEYVKAGAEAQLLKLSSIPDEEMVGEIAKLPKADCRRCPYWKTCERTDGANMGKEFSEMVCKHEAHQILTQLNPIFKARELKAVEDAVQKERERFFSEATKWLKENGTGWALSSWQALKETKKEAKHG